MKTIASLIAMSLLTSWAAADGDLRPLPRVEPQRLAGTWYELARLPDEDTSGCDSDATEHYAARADGGFTVTSSCRTPTGRLNTEVGRAWSNDRQHANASRMTLSYMPRGLQWLPLRRSEWWVVMLDPRQGFAVVSEPSGRHLKVLARSPALPADQLGRIVDRLSRSGYPTRRLVLTRHNAGLHELGARPGGPLTMTITGATSS